MFTKKLPRCVSVAAVTAISVPTVTGAVLKLLLKSGEIVKAANQAKKAFNDVKQMSVELTEQLNPQTSENTTNDVVEEVN